MARDPISDIRKNRNFPTVAERIKKLLAGPRALSNKIERTFKKGIGAIPKAERGIARKRKNKKKKSLRTKLTEFFA